MTQAEKDLLQTFIDERKVANDLALSQLSLSKINKAPGANTLVEMLEEYLTTYQKLSNLSVTLQSVAVSGSI